MIALTYSRDADRVRNVMAAGQCRLETRGTVVSLHAPHILHDDHRELVPPLVRTVLGIAHVDDFMIRSFEDQA